MKVVFSFFLVLMANTSLFAQITVTVKFQPDTVYMVTNYQYKDIDRRIFFEYEAFRNSNSEYSLANNLANSNLVSLTSNSSNWRYFNLISGSAPGISKGMLRVQNTLMRSDSVEFNFKIMDAEYDTLSSLLNNSFYQRGIPNQKWLLLSIPITYTTPYTHPLYTDHSSYFSFLGAGDDDYRMYSLDENGKTKNVTKDDSLFFREGAAYWFKTKSTLGKFNLKIPFSGKRKIGQAFSHNYKTKKGWRLLGSPYDYPVFWRSENKAARIWSFNPDTQTWREISQIEMVYPWGAYAVYSVDEENVIFYHRYGANYAVTNPAKRANPILAKAELSINGQPLSFGFSLDSKDGLDINDDPLMPQSPDNATQPSYLKRENRALISDFKSETLFSDETQIHTWNLVLPKGIHELNLTEFEGFGFDSEIILTGENEFIKLEKNKLIQIKTNSETNFTLHVGKRERLQTEIKPKKPLLHSVYPNPFNPTTTLRFSLPEQADVNVLWFDVSGKLIKTDSHGELRSGFNEVKLNGSSMASGIYFIRIQINGKFELGKKITLLK
jgi:hypothetical protein